MQGFEFTIRIPPPSAMASNWHPFGNGIDIAIGHSVWSFGSKIPYSLNMDKFSGQKNAAHFYSINRSLRKYDDDMATVMKFTSKDAAIQMGNL